MEKEAIEYIKGDQKMFNDKRKELQAKTEEAEELERKLERGRLEMIPIENRMKELHQLETNYGGIIKEKSRAETIRDEKRKRIEEIERNLQYVVDEGQTDEKVEELYDHYRKEKVIKEKAKGRLDGEISNAKDKLKKESADSESAIAHLGTYKSKQDEYNTDKRKLTEKVAEFREDFSACDENDRNGLLDDLEDKIRDENRELKRISQSMDMNLEEKNEELNELKRNSALDADKKKRIADEMIKSKKEIAEITRKLNQNREAFSALEELGGKCDGLSAELENERKKVDLDGLRREVKELKVNLSKLERKEKDLREEKIVLESNQKVLNDISVKEEDKNGKRTQFDKLMNKSRKNLEILFGAKKINPENLKQDFNRCAENLTNERKSAETEAMNLKQNSEIKKSEKKRLNDEINSKKDQIDAFNMILSEVH